MSDDATLLYLGKETLGETVIHRFLPHFDKIHVSRASAVLCPIILKSRLDSYLHRPSHKTNFQVFQELKVSQCPSVRPAQVCLKY